MARTAIQPEGVAAPKAPYSPAAVSGDLVATSGQVAFDADGRIVPGGIREQTRRALENVEHCLAAAGCMLDDVLKVTAFIGDLDDLPDYNEVYAAFFDPPYPARTTVQAGLPAGLLIEIEAVARRPAP
jgi:2-iminobutanoate/2-iminopropanoate deaminase